MARAINAGGCRRRHANPLPGEIACPHPRSVPRARVPLRSESRHPHANPYAASEKSNRDDPAVRNAIDAPRVPADGVHGGL